MAWGGWLAKPEPRARRKAREARAEAKVKKAVRPVVAARDGHCRLLGVLLFAPCEGPSEWNHLERRALTRGKAPEERHSTANSCMNCKRHHEAIDQHRIGFEYATPAGADGLMRFTLAATGQVHEEG